MPCRPVISSSSKKMSMKENGLAEAVTDTDTEKVKKLMELLNTTGKKLWRLNALLHQEALYAEDFDTKTFEPLIRRYKNEVGTVDAIMFATAECETFLSSISTNKQMYHHYLEKFENILSAPTADNNILGLLEAVSQLNRTHSESFLKPEDSDEEVSDNVGIGTDEIDACVKPPHVANQEFSRAQIQDTATTTRIQEVMPFTTPTGRKKKGSLRSFHSTTPIHSLQQAMMAEVSCSDTDLESDAGGKDRYKVIKSKPRHRKPVAKVFDYNMPTSPGARSMTCLTPNLTSPPRNTSNAVIGLSTPESIIEINENKESSKKLMNSPKYSSESWFECKERLRALDIQERLSPSHKKHSPVQTIKGSPKVQQFVSPTDSKKSVRFTLTPTSSARTTPRRTKEVKRRNQNVETDTSDDDHVGFYHQQFPAK